MRKLLPISIVVCILSIFMIYIDAIPFGISATLLAASFITFEFARARDFFVRGMNFYGYCNLAVAVVALLLTIIFVIASIFLSA